MFESPVTLIESKKQKTLFEDVDGSKVVAYLEKDSPGTPEAKVRTFFCSQLERLHAVADLGKGPRWGEGVPLPLILVKTRKKSQKEVTLTGQAIKTFPATLAQGLDPSWTCESLFLLTLANNNP